MYKSGRGTNFNSSQMSTVESVTNVIPILEPIVENDNLSDSSSSMDFETHALASVPKSRSMEGLPLQVLMYMRQNFTKIL